MKEGEEYYVFLKKLKTAAGYRLPDREKNAFLPVAALYSKLKEAFPQAYKNRTTVEIAFEFGVVRECKIIFGEAFTYCICFANPKYQLSKLPSYIF